MTWTYGGDPQVSPKDQVRFLCGDTKVADSFITDEEIAFLLSLRGSPQAAAREAGAVILAKLSEEVAYETGPLKVQAQQRFEQYKAIWEARRTMMIGINAFPSWQDPSAAGSTNLFNIGIHDNQGIIYTVDGN